MERRQASTSSGWFSGRTRLITVVSILAVSVAGVSAVSANIGILDSAVDTKVGTAAATGDLTAATSAVTVMPSSTTGSASPTTSALEVKEFSVDVAGTVALSSTGTALRLDTVSPSPGWTWSLEQDNPTGVIVTFTDGARTLVFLAGISPDGSIAAAVDEPIVVPATGTAPQSGYVDDDPYDDDPYADDSYDDDSHDDDLDDPGDDHDDLDDDVDDHDDHDEYDGRDDDD